MVLTKLLEYIKEKSAGLYGHSKTQRRKFVARLGGLTIWNLKQLIFTIASAATIVAIADLIWWVMNL